MGDTMIREEVRRRSGIKVVYEAVDGTSDEMCFTLGVWVLLEDAMAAFEGVKDPNDIGCHDHEGWEEECVVEIRKREIGWCGAGVRVAMFRWESAYDDGADEHVWRRLPTVLGSEG
jgi:hypothetical protein